MHIPEIPNLDAMDEHSLRMFAPIADLLASYARTKAHAMSLRTLGHIDGALQVESECERIYLKLPPVARW